MSRGFTRNSPKGNTNRLYESFNDEPNQTKIVRAWSISKQMVACVFEKKTEHVAAVPQKHCRIVISEGYIAVFQDIRKTDPS